MDITTKGNTNILVGDRLNLTIPAENISSQNFDVLTVEHLLSNAQFTTRAIMVDTADTRAAPVVTDRELLIKKFREQWEIGKGYMATVTFKGKSRRVA